MRISGTSGESMSSRISFELFAQLPGSQLDLALGAALIAKDRYPSLDVDGVAAAVRALALPLKGAALDRAPLQTQAIVLGKYVFGELGFRANRDNYYDARNSYLPDVLERKLGIPISLSLIYIEIATVLGVTAVGINFPGHYLVRLGVGSGARLIDPFNDGAMLSDLDLRELLPKAERQKFAPSMLVAASVRDTLVRMLVNLKWIYASRGELAFTLLALDRMLLLAPHSLGLRHERALLSIQLGAVETARADFLILETAGAPAANLNELRRAIEQRVVAKPPSIN